MVRTVHKDELTRDGKGAIFETHGCTHKTYLVYLNRFQTFYTERKNEMSTRPFFTELNKTMLK